MTAASHQGAIETLSLLLWGTRCSPLIFLYVVAVPKMLLGLHVCCLHLKHRFPPTLNSIPDPKQPPSNSDSYSDSAVFSPRMLDVRSHLWWLFREVWQKRGHSEPQIVLIQLLLPWGLTTAPEERGQRNGLGPWHWPSSLFTSRQTEEVVALTAEPRVQSQSGRLNPVFSNWTMIIYLLHRRLFVPMSPLRAVPRPTSTCDKNQFMITWNLKSFCVGRAKHTLHDKKCCWKRNKSSQIWAGAMEPSHQSDGFAQHTRPPVCRGSIVDLSHMKESLSHCSLPINLFKSNHSPSTCLLLYWGI